MGSGSNYPTDRDLSAFCIALFNLSTTGVSKDLFSESPLNFSGPKSRLSNCNPLVLKS